MGPLVPSSSRKQHAREARAGGNSGNWPPASGIPPPTAGSAGTPTAGIPGQGQRPGNWARGSCARCSSRTPRVPPAPSSLQGPAESKGPEASFLQGLPKTCSRSWQVTRPASTRRLWVGLTLCLRVGKLRLRGAGGSPSSQAPCFSREAAAWDEAGWPPASRQDPHLLPLTTPPGQRCLPHFRDERTEAWLREPFLSRPFLLEGRLGVHSISSDPAPSPHCVPGGETVRLGSQGCAQGQEPGTQARAHVGAHAHTRRPARKASPATRFPEEGAGWRTRAPRATRPLPPSDAFPGPSWASSPPFPLLGWRPNARPPGLQMAGVWNGLPLQGDCGCLTRAQSAASPATSLPSLTSARHLRPVHPALGEQPPSIGQ